MHPHGETTPPNQHHLAPSRSHGSSNQSHSMEARHLMHSPHHANVAPPHTRYTLAHLHHRRRRCAPHMSHHRHHQPSHCRPLPTTAQRAATHFHLRRRPNGRSSWEVTYHSHSPCLLMPQTHSQPVCTPGHLQTPPKCDTARDSRQSCPMCVDSTYRHKQIRHGLAVRPTARHRSRHGRHHQPTIQGPTHSHRNDPVRACRCTQGRRRIRGHRLTR